MPLWPYQHFPLVDCILVYIPIRLPVQWSALERSMCLIRSWYSSALTMPSTISYSTKSSSIRWRYLGVCGVVLLPAIIVYALLFPASFSRRKTPLLPGKTKSEQLCRQATSLYPTKNGAVYRSLANASASEVFRSRVVDWVSIHITLWIVKFADVHF